MGKLKLERSIRTRSAVVDYADELTGSHISCDNVTQLNPMFPISDLLSQQYCIKTSTHTIHAFIKVISLPFLLLPSSYSLLPIPRKSPQILHLHRPQRLLIRRLEKHLWHNFIPIGFPTPRIKSL